MYMNRYDADTWLDGKTPFGQFLRVPQDRILLINQVPYRGVYGSVTLRIVVEGLLEEVLMNFQREELP